MKYPELSQSKWPSKKQTLIIAMCFLALIVLGICTKSVLLLLGVAFVGYLLVKEIIQSVKYKHWVERTKKSHTIDELDERRREAHNLFK